MVLIFARAFAETGVPLDGEVVVIGEAPEVASSPSQVTVIETEALPNSADVATAVERAPGVVVRRLGGQGDLAQVAIRGAGARQTEVLVDGIPLNPEGGSAVDLSELPLRAFETIEVYRGAAPVLLGTTALGGAVSLVPGDRTGANLALAGGSFGTARGTATVGEDLPFGHLWVAVDQLRTAGDFRYFDNGQTVFDTADDRLVARDNNDTGAITTLERVATEGDGPRLIVLHSGLWRTDGVPGQMFAPTPTVRYAVQRHLLGARLDGDTGSTALGLRAFGVIRRESLSDPNEELFDGSQGPQVSTSVGVDGTARIAIRRDLRVDTSLGGRVDRFVRPTPSVRGFGNTAARQVVRGAMAVPIEAGDVTVVPGVIGLAITDPDTRILGLPRLGAVVRGAGWAWKGNVGAFARPPDLVELYGDRGGLVGNPELRPEHGLQLDLGPSIEREGARFEIVAFFAHYRDLIVWAALPQGVARPENVDRADTGGVELAAGWDRGPWTVGGNATLNRAVNRSSDATYHGNQLPRVPLVDVLVTTGVVVGPARLAVDGAFAAGTFADTANIVALPAHTTVGATAELAGEHLALEVDVRNVLGTRVARVLRDPLSEDGVRIDAPIVDFPGYPLPGRSVLVTVRLVP